jgi:hypothetical protein
MECNIKMDLREIVLEGVYCMHLALDRYRSYEYDNGSSSSIKSDECLD